MMRFTLIFIALIYSLSANARQDKNLYFTSLKSDSTLRVTHFELLPDKGYDLETISRSTQWLHDTTQILDLSKSRIFWLKLAVVNHSHFSTKYSAWVHPQAANTLYYIDKEKNDWQSVDAGLVVYDAKRRTGLMPFKIAGNDTLLLYFKVDATAIGNDQEKIFADLYIEPQTISDQIETRQELLLAATLSVIMMLFFYNLYIWYVFKDRTYGYYLMILAGASLYILGINRWFNVLFPFRWTAFELKANGNLFFVELNAVLINISILIIIIGFIQFTRYYLKLSNLSKKWDSVLFWLNYLFGILIAISTILMLMRNIGLHIYFNSFVNISVVLILGCLILVAFISLKRGFIPAKFYLIANFIPLVLMIVLGIYFLNYYNTSFWITTLPNISVVLQALALSVALVARIEVLKAELAHYKYEYELGQLTNELLNERLEFHRRELASSSMYLYQKNELINNLRILLEEVNWKEIPQSIGAYKKLKSTINSNLNLDADWEKFKLHFEQVHPNFFEHLKESHPTLTKNEVRLSAYLHINLSTKEIASLLNIDPESVRKAKTRLNKKLNGREDVD